MIQLSGQNEVKRKGLLEFLRDPSSFSKCIPNLESLEVKSASEFSAKFKVEVPEEMDITYLKNLGMKMNFKISSHDNAVTMHGEGRSMGLKLKIDINVEIIEREAYSIMSWNASFDAGLLEKLLGKEKIKEFSDSIILKMVECINS
ncbi:MAG: SRPBCC domain-containing protein [Conexivisphaerales archaeon]